jgi:serine/threonine protein kinase
VDSPKGPGGRLEDGRIQPVQRAEQKNDDLYQEFNGPWLPDSAPASVISDFDEPDRLVILAEMEATWILNLSMRFKDHSDREKFFVTYAQEPNKWRRVTISLDYRGFTPDSLEADLKSLHYQRDKSARIFESIRDSLPDIQFYPTVTNLKLQTMDGRLHVHVTEDLNEIIPYPPVSILQHISCPRFKESSVIYDAHMSGFVYKIKLSGRTLVKKEIPGPEAVDEFIYEANALSILCGSQNIIQFEGLIVDDDDSVVKGLLLSFASKGALVDMIYEYKHSDSLSWSRRQRWARQIISGLSELHENGFVQGDFTLSNIVIDAEDDARIIDINRRGCPVGWEPPELTKMIHSGQRISMFIGPKTDLFQLGMVLWALAMQADEPEREERPLRPISAAGIPAFYRRIVEICLEPNPKARRSAKELLDLFPEYSTQVSVESVPVASDRRSSSLHRPQKEYIDPEAAVHLEDILPIPQPQRLRPQSQISGLSSGVTFADGTASSEYVFNSCDSCIVDRGAREASPVTQSDSNGSVQFEDCSEFRDDKVSKTWNLPKFEKPGLEPDPVASPTETVQRNTTPGSEEYLISGTKSDPNSKALASDSIPMDESQSEVATPKPHSSFSSVDGLPGLSNRVGSLQLGTPLHTDSGFDEPSDETLRPDQHHDPTDPTDPECYLLQTPITDTVTPGLP